jgi:glycosyltransferase involved in cell wall biosynthesis
MFSKKQVTIVINTLSGGGAQRVCVNVANGLINVGWQVDLVVLNYNNEAFLRHVSKKINLIQLNVNHTRYASYSLLKYVYQKKPNVFLVFNYELTVLLILLRSLLKFKYKIISRNINTLSKKYEEFKQQNFWVKNVVGTLIDNFYCKADHVINQCYAMHEDIVKLHPELKNNSSVIYNPITNYILDYANSHDLNQIKKKNYLLCVGRLEKQKAFHYAIEGFAGIAQKFPDLRLKILGEGSLKQELEQTSKDYSIADRVDFEGFQKNIIPYYLYAKATVLTSLNEGFPNVLIESIILGTPVVSFDCPSGPEELIKEGINGYLVKHKNVDDLKKKLLTIMTSQFSIDKMNLTIKKHELNEVVKYYEKLLNSFL